MYLLIKVISRLFLPSGDKKQKRSGFFYRNIQRPYEKGRYPNGKASSDSRSDRFSEIEEAEYEDITEEEKSSSKTSD